MGQGADAPESWPLYDRRDGGSSGGIELYKRLGDPENLCEELGDLLFLILLQSQIAEEEGIFTLDDVIDAIGKKMIRRHPHVFRIRKTEEKIQAGKKLKNRKRVGKTTIFFGNRKKFCSASKKR